MVLCLLHHHRPNIHIGNWKALYFIYGEIQGLEHMVLNGAYGGGGGGPPLNNAGLMLAHVFYAGPTLTQHWVEIL